MNALRVVRFISSPRQRSSVRVLFPRAPSVVCKYFISKCGAFGGGERGGWAGGSGGGGGGLHSKLEEDLSYCYT